MTRFLRFTYCLALASLFIASASPSLSADSAPPNPADAPLRIVLVGDSTVSEYPPDRPDRGWGQFLQQHFTTGTVTVINLAARGRSTKTFINEGRWKQALAKQPDYVLIQFGHNDSHDPKNPEATDPAGDYSDYLRQYIDESRAIGATPILVTPVVRRTFNDAGEITETLSPPNRPLADYAKAMRTVAGEKDAALIDLHASSKALLEELGPEAGKELANRAGDVTHFNAKGARLTAQLVVEQLPEAAPQLAARLKSSPQAP